ncbi:DUF1223 domain-containing protein [Oceanicoccus sp. KOV_DT_Chl]|uniref:DUF1223 domain-containing protein n=1 Tax=Oceanicoccus sp. KOV_DT_Chl TaxID=1904639 RepID=UPI000C7A1812|nr:DUF1223 domain-containing protein [Oceanicoccus sp. KOV_DT_Chl]
MIIHRFLSVSFLSLLCSHYSIAELRLNSGPQQTQLIELYTSEGCSSCPPADAFLSGYKNHPHLWQKIIPVAFHVDYWDDIGWPDRFASPQYSLRQRQHARQGNVRQVYTPGFVVNGAEWKGWYRQQRLPKLSSGDSEQRPGNLSLQLKQNTFTATFDPAALNAGVNQVATLSIAILGFDLSTDIKAGENKGRELKHDFVVLALQHYRSNDMQWQGELPEVDKARQQTQQALAAWVSTSTAIKPLQAVAGWLPAP